MEIFECVEEWGKGGEYSTLMEYAMEVSMNYILHRGWETLKYILESSCWRKCYGYVSNQRKQCSAACHGYFNMSRHDHLTT